MVFDKRKQAKAGAEHQAAIEASSMRARLAFDALEAARLRETMPPSEAGIMPKKDELVYATVDGAGLIEPRRTPGHWSGGSHGVSFRVAKGMSYRIGQTRGTYTQGEERPTVIDVGKFVITSQRCVFIGGKRTTEWQYAKLVGFSLDGEAVAIFNVSNRQKASGVQYGVEHEHLIDSWVAAAIARWSGEEAHARLVAEMEQGYSAAWREWQTLEQPAPGPELSKGWAPPSGPALR